MGDFNVAHQVIDIARSQANEGSAGFTKQERNWMSQFLEKDYIDSWRFFNPEKIQYTWWSYRAQARQKNIGWRLDYCCFSWEFKNKIKKALVLDKIFGSDHCPIGLEISEK